MTDPIDTQPSAAPAPVAAGGPPAVPGYDLHGEVGRGGMGVVYRATDLALGREVAVKVLGDRFPPGSPTATRFRDEARITAALQHPGVPPVYHVGELPDGRPFLAMKLIKGDTLDQKLKAGAPVDPLAVFAAVAQAVGYAHAHGVIHRDLKPANVMVGAFGEVQVMDWGLAKVLTPGAGAAPAGDPDTTVAHSAVRSTRDSEAAFTEYGSALGTPAYMPPEQAAGELDKVDRRSDVFGLGAILCVLLTGKPPYAGASAEAVRIAAVRGETAAALARLDACGADPGVVALCKRCLAFAPADRPADAEAVAAEAAALRAAADDRARQAEREKAAAVVRAAEEGKRRRVWLALCGAVGLLLLAAGGFGWYADRQFRSDRERRVRAAEAMGGLLDQAEAALAAGEGARAGQLLDAADQRAAESGAEGLAARRALLRADLAVLRALEEADYFRWNVTVGGGGYPDRQQVADRYQLALAGFGADPAAVSPDEAAGRVARSAVRERLTAALDQLLWHGRSERVRQTLRLADPDPFRDAVRDAWASGRTSDLKDLCERPEAAERPLFARVLAEATDVPVEVRRGLLRRALHKRPGDLGLLMTMGMTYPINNRDAAPHRVRWYQAAVAVANNAPTNLSLGSALRDLWDLEGALACARDAIRQEPNYANAHNLMAIVLSAKKEHAAAAAAFREAIRLDPTVAIYQLNLGFVLELLGDIEGTIAAFREAARLDPKIPFAASHQARAERLRDLVTRAPQILAGSDRPDASHLLELAVHFSKRGQNRFADAARLFEMSFAADPKPAENLDEGFRYKAAYCAALAAYGEGHAAPPGEAERAALRAKAAAWLRADLAVLKVRAASADPKDRQFAARKLTHWLADADLNGLRPGPARAGVPAAEQEDLDRFWAEVKTTLARASQPIGPDPALTPGREG